MYKNKFPEGTHPYAYDMKDLARYYVRCVEGDETGAVLIADTPMESG